MQRAQQAEAGLAAAQEAVAAASEEVLSLKAEMRDMRIRLAPAGAGDVIAEELRLPSHAEELSRSGPDQTFELC